MRPLKKYSIAKRYYHLARVVLKCLKSAYYLRKDIEECINEGRFWNKHAKTTFNDRQKLMLNKLLDGDFTGNCNLQNGRKCVNAPKTRQFDINLMDKGILQQEEAGGRSTNYMLKT